MTTRKHETVPAQRDHISAEATEPECHCPVLEKKEGVAPTDRGDGKDSPYTDAAQPGLGLERLRGA